MKKIVFLSIVLICSLSIILGCSKSKDPSKETEDLLEVPVVRQSSVEKRGMQNEPDSFRGIKFGVSIDELKKNYKLIFVRSGYGMLFVDKATTEDTIFISKKGGRMSGNLLANPDQKHRCLDCLSEDGKKAKIYQIAEDKLKIGSLPLDLIWYHFYEGRFCGIQIQFNAKYWNEMEDLYCGLYGEKVDAADSRAGWHKWVGEYVSIKLWKVPKFSFFEKGFVEYCYLPISKEDTQRYQVEMAEWWEKRKNEMDRTKKENQKKYHKVSKEDL